MMHPSPACSTLAQRAMARRRTLHIRRSDAEKHGADGHEESTSVEIQPGELANVFAVPSWLRDLGMTAWLLVGVVVLLVGAIWLVGLTSTITIPVIVATIVAAVLSPVVGWLADRGLGRGGGAVLVFLLTTAIGVGVFLMLVGGVTSQAPELERTLHRAVDKVQGWLQDAGVSASTAKSTADDASKTTGNAFHALLKGVSFGIEALASVAVFLSFTALSLFFLLKDGPQIRTWVERHMGVPEPVARVVTGRTLGSLRGYFVGVTAVAAFNAIVIGLGALVLGVPKVGSIMAINFVAAYVPYLGAWSAGAFTVLVALGSEGTETAIAMAVVALLANGVLQQLIQPVAYGAALGIHPLAVLIVTIAGGSLFGAIGLVLAAPLTSAIVRISSDLSRARAAESREAPSSEAPPPEGDQPAATPAAG
jgi:putative heme transporter